VPNVYAWLVPAPVPRRSARAASSKVGSSRHAVAWLASEGRRAALVVRQACCAPPLIGCVVGAVCFAASIASLPVLVSDVSKLDILLAARRAGDTPRVAQLIADEHFFSHSRMRNLTQQCNWAGPVAHETMAQTSSRRGSTRAATPPTASTHHAANGPTNAWTKRDSQSSAHGPTTDGSTARASNVSSANGEWQLHSSLICNVDNHGGDALTHQHRGKPTSFVSARSVSACAEACARNAKCVAVLLYREKGKPSSGPSSRIKSCSLRSRVVLTACTPSNEVDVYVRVEG
jgi:hypothetical protein